MPEKRKKEEFNTVNFPLFLFKKKLHLRTKKINLMPVFLFEQIIFGPVKSRRLGVSLGINLLPLQYKFCNFDCIYCECGRTYKDKFIKNSFHKREIVSSELQKKLTEMKNEGKMPDVITFAGNGEPTMHPEFEKIIDDTLEIRNRLAPNTKIAVLSNATLINKAHIFDALNKIELNILKLDSALEETVKILNNPPANYTIEKTVENLKKFKGNFILQTMFVKGTYKGEFIDNSTDLEVESWLKLVKEIDPKQVMIYTIERDTPEKGLQKVDKQRLAEISEFVELAGFNTQISE